MTEMKINQQELMAACQEVIQYSRKMAADGLVVGTSGNVSRRIGDLIAITPSGVDYDILKPEDICLLELDGTPVRCDRAPSSELPLHLQGETGCECGRTYPFSLCVGPVHTYG